jgi:hypothetical protein
MYFYSASLVAKSFVSQKVQFCTKLQYLFARYKLCMALQCLFLHHFYFLFFMHEMYFNFVICHNHVFQ